MQVKQALLVPCTPAIASPLVAELSTLFLDVELSDLQQHLATSKRRAATALAISAQQGTHESYSKAREGALAFEDELRPDLLVCLTRHALIGHFQKPRTSGRGNQMHDTPTRTPRVMQDASKAIARRQEVATNALAHAARTADHSAVMAAVQCATDVGVPPSVLDPHRQVWLHREVAVRARSKAAAEAVPFQASEFEAAVAEVWPSAVLPEPNAGGIRF